MGGRIGYYALGASLACLFGLLATPSSYWVVRLHAGVLGNEWRLTSRWPKALATGEPSGLWELSVLDHDGASRFEGKLAAALFAKTPEERLAAIQGLDQAAQRGHDPAQAVVVVRHWVSWVAASNRPTDTRALVDACRRAILLDPGNAFVWFCMAYALVLDKGREADVSEIIRHAATLDGYSDYSVYEAEAISGAFLRQRGYRGEFVGQYILPDALPSTIDRAFTGVAEWVAERGLANGAIGDAASQTIRRAFLATRTGRELGAVASAYRTLLESIRAQRGADGYAEYERSKRIAGYQAYLAEIARTRENVRGRSNAPRLNRDEFAAAVVWRSSLGGLLVAAATAGAIGYVLAAARRRVPIWLSFVAAGVGFVVVAGLGGDWPSAVPAVLALCLGLPIRTNGRRWTLTATALAGAAWASTSEGLALVPSFVLVLAVLERELPCRPFRWGVLVLTALAATGAWVLIGAAMDRPEVRVFMATICLLPWLSAARELRLAEARAVTGLTLAVASFAYVAAVADETRANEVLRATEASWRYEIERAKNAAVLDQTRR